MPIVEEIGDGNYKLLAEATSFVILKSGMQETIRHSNHMDTKFPAWQVYSFAHADILNHEPVHHKSHPHEEFRIDLDSLSSRSKNDNLAARAFGVLSKHPRASHLKLKSNVAKSIVGRYETYEQRVLSKKARRNIDVQPESVQPSK